MEDFKMKKTLRLTSIALVLMMLLTLTACVPADAAKAKEKMEKKEYTATAVTGTLAEAAGKVLGVDGLTETMTATKTVKDKDGKDTVELVSAYWFEEASQAKDAFEKIEADAKKESKDNDNFVCKRSGKVIYAGTKQAAKDFN